MNASIQILKVGTSLASDATQCGDLRELHLAGASETGDAEESEKCLIEGADLNA